MLASFLVDELNNKQSPNFLSDQIYYFFFKDDNEHQRNATLALCAILHQIIDANHDLVKYAHVQREKKGSGFTDEFHTLWNLLLTVAVSNQSKSIIIVLDALDECEETTRTLLMEALVDLHSSSSKTNLERQIPRFIVTSRPYRRIETRFRNLTHVRLKGEYENMAITGDIELMIRSTMKDVAGTIHLNQARAAALEDALIAKSDRTFLWISPIMKMIEYSIEGTDEDFQETIDTLPPDLYSIYEKILNASPKLDNAR